MSTKLKNVRRDPFPVSVRAVQRSQGHTETDRVERDGRGLCVADKEEEDRSGKASQKAPPQVVFYEEISEMTNQDQDDCGSFQPVSVVNYVRLEFRTRGIVNSSTQTCAADKLRGAPSVRGWRQVHLLQDQGQRHDGCIPLNHRAAHYRGPDADGAAVVNLSSLHLQDHVLEGVKLGVPVDNTIIAKVHRIPVEAL